MSVERPVLAPRFHSVLTRGRDAVLLGEDDYAVLEGELVARIAGLADGTRTADEIACEFEEDVDRAAVHYVMLQLARRGLLREAFAERTLGRRAAGASPGGPRPLPDAAHRVRFLGIRGGAILDVFTEAGVFTAPDHPLLIVTDDYTRPDLFALDSELRAQQTAYLLVRATARRGWVGPLIHPWGDPCWRCVGPRLRANLAAWTYARERWSEPPPHVASSSELLVGYRALARLVRRMLGGRGVERLRSRLLVLDCESGVVTRHHVGARPDCPECGFAASDEPALELAPVATGRNWRSRSERVTYRRLRRHVSPITGAVRRITPVSIESVPFYVCSAAYPLTHQAPTLETLKAGTRDRAAGRGWSPEAARTAALCEAVERESSVFRGNERACVAAYDDLEGAVAPGSLLQFSDRQYAERRAWNRACTGRFNLVPEPYVSTRPISWSPVWSLTQQAARHVPTAYLYFGFPGPGSRCCPADSNGLAAGGRLEEAVLYGLLELVERDAVALWWYNRTRQRTVRIESFEDDRSDSLVRAHQRVGRRVWALDITTDLSVPSFVALSANRDGGEVAFGFGAHLEPGLALRRALAESTQMLATVQRSPSERRRQLVPEFEDAVTWWETATTRNQPYLLPTAGAAVDASTYAPPAVEDFKMAIDQLVDVLAARNMEVLVSDQTRGGVDLHVVKVIVPGLRHFWRRLAPGRLYQIPVELGRLATPCPEGDINPVSMFV